ncbi:unnamed protein product [Rhizophagus irregularis]|nr:unnamed protein product [Rhizophagus irregularis]
MIRIILIVILIYYFIKTFFYSKTQIKWISFSRIKYLKEIARGNFGIIYQAIWEDKPVAIKKFSNPKYFDKYFLNELRSHCKCCGCGCINRCYGITMDPETKEYMLVLQYAKGGNLHEYLQTNFVNITWKEKIEIFYQISMGGNILHLEPNLKKRFQIADLGLAQPENIPSDEKYGVLPYMAPELLFKDFKFSKASDVYSMGMIMWEITTGRKPFADVKYPHCIFYKILDGGRPKITEDTPECVKKLMERCWDPDPGRRPSMDEIHETLSDIRNEEFNEADQKRLELIELKKLGPEKPHLKAFYMRRSSSLYSNELSLIEQGNEEYVTREYEFDITL